MKKTTNYQFPQYDPTGTDGDLHGTDFIGNTFGVNDDCFVSTLDSLLKMQDGRVSDLEKHQGLTLASVDATKISDIAYTATDENIKEYDVGMTIILHLDTTNVGKVTLNINGFGAVPIKKVDGQGNIIDLEANDLVINRGRMVQYDGTQFMLINDDVCSIQKRETVVKDLSSAISIGTPVNMNATVMDNDLVAVAVDGKLMAEGTDYTRIGNKLTFKTALTSGQKIVMFVDHSFIMRQVGEDATTLAGLQTNIQGLKSNVSGINSHLADVDKNVTSAINNANGRIPKVSNATYGNIPVLQSDGSLKDSGKSYTAYLTKGDLLTYVFPVGTYYISFNNASPASFLGGTWMRQEDVFLYGSTQDEMAKGTYYGGNKTATLIKNNVPKMQATFNGYCSVDHNFDGASVQVRSRYPASSDPDEYVGMTGGNAEPFSIMPPYVGVYIWKRLS